MQHNFIVPQYFIVVCEKIIGVSLQLLLLCKSLNHAKQLHWMLRAIRVFWDRKCCSEEENSAVTNTDGTTSFTMASTVWIQRSSQVYQLWATFPQQSMTIKAFSHCSVNYCPLCHPPNVQGCDCHVTEGFPIILKVSRGHLFLLDKHAKYFPQINADVAWLPWAMSCVGLTLSNCFLQSQTR